MKKVLQILYSGLGGHGSVAFSLLAAARSAQAWQGQLVFVGIEPVVGEYEHACSRLSIESAHVRTHAGKAWRSWPALYRALEQARPDAIILHSVKTILPCALYAARRRIPLVAVEHQPNALKHRGEWLASRLLMQLADAVVVLTQDYRGQLQARLGRGWRDRKVFLIPNGIDTDTFAPDAPAATSPPRLIGMAARMSGTKRQDVLVDAFARLVAEDGPGQWRLSLAGDGETMQSLRERVHALGLDGEVAFTGYLGEAELLRWFKSLDLYAHASDGETLSTSLLQAMAIGLPIVGSDVPGICNLLAAGGGVGLLAEQSPEAFAAALRKIATEPALALELRQRSRALAVAEYSQAAMFARYNALLEQLCGA